MSEDKTAETKDPRSFEERVFARFDAVDERFERIEGRLLNVEIRITKLEDRQYDTKPIWEHALAAIAELNERMLKGFAEIQAQLTAMNSRLDAMDRRFDAIDGRLDAMDVRFDAMDVRFDAMDVRFDAMDRRFDAIDQRSQVIEGRLSTQDVDSNNNFRGLERKLDVLNKNIFELRADQRYVDSRLEKIESQAKPS
jgi:chromosome segregation ATPase